MKVPFERPDDDDPAVRAERKVLDSAPPPSDPPPNHGQRGTRVLVGVALVAILVGAALVAIPALSGDDGDDSDALPDSWPPDDQSQVWAKPAANPEAAACGEAVGLLIDRSVPVDPGRTVPNLSVTTDAAGSFVRGIGITPTPVGFWSFGTYGDPTGDEDFGDPGGVPDFPARPPVLVAGLAGAENLADVQAGLSSIPFGFTSQDSDQVELSERNWEAGLRAVLDSGEAPRTLVLITTGSPTTHDGDEERDNGVDLPDLDAAILAANELKAAGTRIVVVGVDGADRIALETISGPASGDPESLELGDYYSVDQDALSATLDHIAAAQCGGTITVDKRVQELAGDDPVVGVGWDYRLTTDGDPVDEAATDDLGLATMGWQDLDAVLLQETGQEGYQLPAGAESESGATCRRAGPDRAVSGLDVPGGFELDVDAGQIIGCTFSSVRSYVDLVLDVEPLQQTTPPGSQARYDITYRNAGTLPATGTVVQFVVPEGATLSAADNDHPWRCPDGFPAQAGAVCTFADPDGTLEPGSPFYAFWVGIQVDDDTDRPEIEARALVMAEGLEDPRPDDNVVAVTTPTSDAPPPTTTVPTTTTTVPPTTTSTTTTTTSTTTTTTTTTTSTTTTTTLPPPPPTTTTSTSTTSTTATTTPPSTTTTSTTVAPPVPLSDDLVVTLVADPPQVASGEYIDFAVLAENDGEAALTNAAVTMIAPPGTTFDLRLSDVGWRCPKGRTCSLDVPTIEPGAATEVGATMRVLEPNGRDSIEFAASLQGESAGTTVAGAGSVDVALETVDVAVVLESVDEPVAGEFATFSVAVTNVGETTATQVELDLDLPAPLELGALSGSDGASCRRVSGRCQFRSIEPGDTEVVTASWRVPASLPSDTVEVSAVVTTELSDAESSNNAAALVATVDGVRVEALATPSGIFDGSDSSIWLGILAGILSVMLIIWIIVSGMRRKRPDAPEPDLGSQPDGA